MLIEKTETAQVQQKSPYATSDSMKQSARSGYAPANPPADK